MTQSLISRIQPDIWFIPSSSGQRRRKLKLKVKGRGLTPALQACQTYSQQWPKRRLEVHANGEHICSFEYGSLILGEGLAKSIRFPIEHGLIFRDANHIKQGEKS